MTTKIFKNYSKFIYRKDQHTNGVSPEFALSNPEFKKKNLSNEKCWNCSACSYCLEKNGEKSPETAVNFNIKIKNIHQRILDAVSIPNALKMSSCHEDESINDAGAYCGTTHCRAG